MSTEYGKNKVLELLVTFLKIFPQYFYIQGLDSVCTVLLVHLEDDTPLILSLLNHIYKQILLKFIKIKSKQLYLDQVIRKFDNLLQFTFPEIFLKFKDESKFDIKLEINSSIFLTPWFVTLFTSLLMSPQVIKLWDFILLIGYQALFLISGVILQFQFKKIETLKSDQILALFSEYIQQIPTDLLKSALQLKQSIPSWLLNSIVDLSYLKAEHIYRLSKSDLPILVIQIDISGDALFSQFTCRIKEQEFVKNIQHLVNIFKKIISLTVVIVNKKSKDLVSQIREIYKLQRLCSCTEEQLDKLKDTVPPLDGNIPSNFKEISAHLKEKYKLN